MPRPLWLAWDLEISAHAAMRMQDRQFTEIDVRRMLEVVEWIEPDSMEGRWRLHVRWRRQDWTVVVEPDPELELMVVVTAFTTGAR